MKRPFLTFSIVVIITSIFATITANLVRNYFEAVAEAAPKHTEEVDTISLNQDNLIREIAKYPFADPDLVFRSAILECGHSLDSYNATARKNIFGMKCSIRRYPCVGGYSVYPTWQESVKDRYVHEALWFRGGDYKDYLNRNWGKMDGKYVDQLYDVLKE